MKIRYLQEMVAQDALASFKMAFISGPRQVGKTTLAKSLLRDQANYFSWDDKPFRRAWMKDPRGALGQIGKGPIVLDELHKHRLWKTSLKSVYDFMGDRLPIIVTGSGRLDFYRKGGDSLSGRYFPYRLFPFSVSEQKRPPSPDDLSPRRCLYSLKDLINLSGFPEPLMVGSRGKALRWSRLRQERLLHEDVRDFRNVNNLTQLEMMFDILPERIGSPFSLNSMKEDVQVAYATLRNWYQVCKYLYVFFEVPPYSKSIARALRKEKKIYLYDTLPISKESAQLENTVALHLYKACLYWTDTAQGHFQLFYLRNKEKEEVDFCVIRDRKVWLLVECKSSSTELSPALIKFHRQLKPEQSFQTTTKKGYDRMDAKTGIRVIETQKFLSMFL